VTNAKTAYEANSNKATKNAVFGELKHFTASFVDNLDVPDVALAAMRPHQHHVHEPLLHPSEEPGLSVRKQHYKITVL
jgi:hypothetical protein